MKKLNVGKDGLRHMMLCRVILGKAEVVHPGSDQYHPSSDEFDSGMDNLSSPKKYIVWSAHMNTHILPEYVISFRAPSNLKGGSSTKLVFDDVLSLGSCLLAVFELQSYGFGCLIVQGTLELPSLRGRPLLLGCHFLLLFLLSQSSYLLLRPS